MSADSSDLHLPGLPLPASPDEKERVAILCAAQAVRGRATVGDVLESLEMLGVLGEATDMAYRHQRERARTAAARTETAAVLQIRKPRQRRRRN